METKRDDKKLARRTFLAQSGLVATGFPHDMMRYGSGGIAGWGTVCGSLNGACAMMTLIAGKAYGQLVNELMAWYGTTPFPSDKANRYAANHDYLVDEYKTDAVLPTTISNSPLCHVSVNTWCRSTGFASGSRQRAERCARLTATWPRRQPNC